MQRLVIGNRVKFCAILLVMTFLFAGVADARQKDYQQNVFDDFAVAEKESEQLENQDTRTFSASSSGQWFRYYISVPEETAKLTVKIDGDNGDADLYTMFGAEPTRRDYDCRPYEADSTEECEVYYPEEGNWYIGVRAYRIFSDVTLKVEYEAGITPPPGDLSYTVTAVKDNLDNTDLYDMADELESLGYSLDILDIDVSTSDLTNYLQRSTTTVYHTGHGNVGYVATSSGGLETSDMAPGKVNVVNTIWATCLTMDDRSWRKAFSDSAETMSGYTNYSWDILDEDVVKNFGDELADGKSYPMAWYLANLPYNNLNDRWFVFARQGNDIVEYSAESGNTPASARAGVDLIAVDRAGKLKVAKEIFAHRRDYNNSFGRVRMLPAKKTRKLARAGLTMLKRTGMTRSDAVARGKLHFSGSNEHTSAMMLSKSFPIKSRKNDNASYETVGWVVRHTMLAPDGLKITGNRVEPHRTLTLTENGEVMASLTYWPRIIMEKEAESCQQLLTPAAAIQIAAEAISMQIKCGSVDIVAVEPVYGISAPASKEQLLVASYAFVGNENFSIVVNAKTGELLR
ncbi:MAG: hypothetical protein GY874_02745 [Desulfobacteraceae bacterium]|nr:hypothetical protein [Desulfobacteraceae bacterium]